MFESTTRSQTRAKTTSVGRVLSVLCFSASWTVHSAPSFQFEVEGNLTYRSFTPDGSTFKTMLRSFLVVVHDSAWYVETRDISPKKEIEELVAWESGSDGVDVYHLERYDGKMREVDFAFPDGKGGMRMAKTNVALPKGMAEITAGPIPHPWIDFAAPLWLAFGSSHYLKTNMTGWLRPVWTFHDPDLLHADFRLEAQQSLSPTAPNLPVSVVYFNDGKVYDDRDHKPAVQAQNPTGVRQPHASYEVLEWGTTDGLSIPRQFKFTRLAPALNGKAGDVRVLELVEGETTAVRSRRIRESLLPDLPPGVPIMDHRFRSTATAPLVYSSTNGWLDVAGVRRFPDFDARIKGARLQARSRNARPGSGWVSRAAYCALIAVLIWPVTAVIFRRKNTNSSTRG